MKRLPLIKAVMTPFPHSVSAEAPLRQAQHMMHEHDIRHLPVKKGNRLVGVLSDRDLKRALDPNLGLSPRNELFVDDAMMHHAYTVDVDTPLHGVLQEMADRHIGCALVVKDGQLAGIFTTTDACRLFAKELKDRFGPPGGNEAA